MNRFSNPRRLLVSSALFAAGALPVSAQTVHHEKLKIEVGPTVQVSKALANAAHNENLAAGDPRHPGRLITCSMVTDDDVEKMCSQNCYTSFDSGKTWQPSLQVTQGMVNGDPTEVYGRGDNVYVVALVREKTDQTIDAEDYHDLIDHTVLFKSTDGGRTFAEASRFQFIDREFVQIDNTNGKYAGRIYIVGQASYRGIDGSRNPSLQMFRSLDDGKTFLGPIHGAYPQGAGIFGVGTGAVLSDGTFVSLFGISKPGREQDMELDPRLGPNAELHVIASSDGGETFSPSHKVADVMLDRSRSEGSILTQLAADPGSKDFKDRIYVVFPAVVEDRVQIQVSYSADKGKTWSAPATVNDDRTPQKGDKGPDHMLPAIGVNKDGVVLVAWYDRRDAGDNLGWRLRAATSLDGGETFSASVPITDGASSFSPNKPWGFYMDSGSDQHTGKVSMRVAMDLFYTSGGHTSGLAVDADGTFHPTWSDNRTGISQLWSASLKVNGTAVKNGSTDLAQLEDISKSVTVELSKPSFDRAKGIFTLHAQLKNISKDTVEGPVKVRVLSMESQLGVPEITNADNGQDGSGAIWDFSSTVSGPLSPLKLASPKTLTFRLSDVRPIAAGRDYKGGVLVIETKVFGKLQKAKDDKPKDSEGK
jgi:hypothetical protein